MGAELAVVSSQRMMMLHLHSQTFHTARRVTQPGVSELSTPVGPMHDSILIRATHHCLGRREQPVVGGCGKHTCLGCHPRQYRLQLPTCSMSGAANIRAALGNPRCTPNTAM